MRKKYRVIQKGSDRIVLKKYTYIGIKSTINNKKNRY